MLPSTPWLEMLRLFPAFQAKLYSAGDSGFTGQSWAGGNWSSIRLHTFCWWLEAGPAFCPHTD